MRLSRRESLAGAGALIAATASPVRAAVPFQSLDQAAKLGRRGFGATVIWTLPGADAPSLTNPRYTALLERECSLLVPENQLKWQWVRRGGPDSFNFQAFDAIADYAAKHHFKLRGHTLFWTPAKWYPNWLAQMDFGPAPAAAGKAEKLLIDHVRTVCRRYGTRVYSYDVVNEAVQPETGEIRDANVTRAVGPERFLDVMFHTARQEAPHAELVYNDYMSWERTPIEDTHMSGVLKLLEGFKKRGTPVDTLGVQSHIRLPKSVPVNEAIRASEGPWRRFLDQVVGMGYKLKITEFDVNDQDAPADITIRDHMVADYGKAYLDLMLGYAQLNDVLCWGITDRYCWLNGFAPRADKLRQRALPYDVDFQPKLFRAAIADSFRSASSRHVG